MQDSCIYYGREIQDISFFVFASDESFMDNLLDQKNFQGYMMKLFSGAVAWRVIKQDTIITFSTKAKLLAILQTAKKAIYLFLLMKSPTLIFPKAPTIKCDNQ